jgi:hypothetical protein
VVLSFVPVQLPNSGELRSDFRREEGERREVRRSAACRQEGLEDEGQSPQGRQEEEIIASISAGSLWLTRIPVADTQLAGAAARANSPRSFRVAWRVVLAIAAVFALVASVRSLIPGVNEPHYLAKARHFWIPDWCGQDLFLTSANAHWFFYATVGWLAAIFPLSIAALLGRIAGWLTLAWGWRQVCSALGFELAQSLISAALLAALGSLGSLSGEWMVGGVELIMRGG